MSPQKEVFRSYAADAAKAVGNLEQAFDAAWAVIEAKGYDPEAELELKVALSRKIVALAIDGVVDPDFPRSLALNGFPLSTA